MRKTLLLSALVAGVLGIVAVAWAANTYTVTTARETPTKSGTLTNPKPVRVQFNYAVSTTDGTRPNTTTDYFINLGSGLKQNSKLKVTRTRFAFAQCKFAQASANNCAASTKVGSGTVQNQAGLSANKSQKIACTLFLTIYNGDGRLYPPARNDGKRVKEDVWLGLKSTATSCPLVVNTTLPAQLVAVGGGTAITFHVTAIPLQHPASGVDNSVVQTAASLFKTARVAGRTRGFFETTSCPRGGRLVKVTFTDASGARNNATKIAPCTK